MDNIEVPEYFICPISLEIMKDPVTTISGITYDRDSIQRWLSINPKCPVSMQPLPPADLIITPNTTLLRLIQSWCSANSLHLTPTLDVSTLIEDLRGPHLIKSILKLEAHASESEPNRLALGARSDLTDSLVSFVVSCNENRSTEGLREALSLFYLIDPTRTPSTRNGKIIESLRWVLSDDCPLDDRAVVKPYAAHFLKAVVERETPRTLEKLTPEFFETVLSNLGLVSQEGVVSLLNVLLDSCPWGKNRDVMVGLGAVSDLVEVDSRGGGEKETTELVLGIMCHLCSCREGRAHLVGHPYGIEAVTRRLLKVSHVADDSAVFVIWIVSRYSGTSGVLEEMVRAGTVGKLCMLMRAADRNVLLKEKVKEILTAHAGVWKGAAAAGPEVVMSTLTRKYSEIKSKQINGKSRHMRYFVV